PLSSMVMPTNIDNKNSVVLSVPGTYEAYQWSTGETTPTIEVSSAGTYTVSVTKPGGCPSDQSKTVTVVINGREDVITAPGSLTAEVVSSSRVNLFWNDNSDNETGFEIYRATDPDGPFTFVTLTDHGDNYFADSSLNPGIEYYYTLRAV